MVGGWEIYLDIYWEGVLGIVNVYSEKVFGVFLFFLVNMDRSERG